MSLNKKIFLADDDSNIREAIKIFLENEGFQVSVFENGDLLYDQFIISPCDLIILDVMMPGSSGFTICKKVRSISTVPIIMLTARDSDIDYANGINLGSDDYFTKPFSAISLVMRVKAIFRRIRFERQNLKTDTANEPLFYGDLKVDLVQKTLSIKGTEIALTPNEFALLCYLITNNRPVSREELLNQIWGYYTEVETRAADDTVRRIRKKVAHSNVQIEAVWGFGFRLSVRDENETVKK